MQPNPLSPGVDDAQLLAFFGEKSPFCELPLRYRGWLLLADMLLDQFAPGWSYSPIEGEKTTDSVGGVCKHKPRAERKLYIEPTQITFQWAYPHVMTRLHRAGILETNCPVLMDLLTQLITLRQRAIAELDTPAYELYKNFINTCYGVMRNPGSPFFCTNSVLIPQAVREVMTTVFERYDNVLYVDTDTLYVHKYQEIAQELGEHLDTLASAYVVEPVESLLIIAMKKVVVVKDGVTRFKGFQPIT